MEESFKYHIPEDIPANERTAFHGAAAAAAKDGKKSFNFGGKTHPVTMKKDTAKAIADQKEGFMNEEYSKTNKASMTIKHGYDEGDGPDNKKFAKYINKNTGATVKHHKDGSTMSFHGSDHQIHKALQIHHSDDKKGLGDLNYHKKGKTHSDDHVDGQHTYKAEGTTFRERLMSIFESDRAKHYKGATEPEGMHDKSKSSKGAMDMLNTPKTIEADGMKAAKDTAANIQKSAPGKKMRKGDQNKGDLAIKPSATPVNDPSAKTQTMENYGVSGNKVSDSLLKAISIVDNYTHEFDVDSEKNAHGMVKKAKAAGMKAKIHTMKGPGGGNPVVHLGHKDTKLMHKFIKKHYDDSYSHDDLNIHKM